jgi:hypothetical protein
MRKLALATAEAAAAMQPPLELAGVAPGNDFSWVELHPRRRRGRRLNRCLLLSGHAAGNDTLAIEAKPPRPWLFGDCGVGQEIVADN